MFLEQRPERLSVAAVDDVRKPGRRSESYSVQILHGERGFVMVLMQHQVHAVFQRQEERVIVELTEPQVDAVRAVSMAAVLPCAVVISNGYVSLLRGREGGGFPDARTEQGFAVVRQELGEGFELVLVAHHDGSDEAGDFLQHGQRDPFVRLVAYVHVVVNGLGCDELW